MWNGNKNDKIATNGSFDSALRRLRSSFSTSMGSRIEPDAILQADPGRRGRGVRQPILVAPYNDPSRLTHFGPQVREYVMGDPRIAYDHAIIGDQLVKVVPVGYQYDSEERAVLRGQVVERRLSGRVKGQMKFQSVPHGLHSLAETLSEEVEEDGEDASAKSWNSREKSDGDMMSLEPVNIEDDNEPRRGGTESKPVQRGEEQLR